MNNEKAPHLHDDERGFTLIELLLTSVILIILGALSIGSFFIYKENAEYSRASTTMRNARTAITVGEMELPEGYELAYTTTTTTGDPLPAALAVALPGGVVPAGVRLGAEVNVCDDSSGPLDRAQYLVAQPCKATQEVRWQKFCGGIEILTEHVANPAPCS